MNVVATTDAVRIHSEMEVRNNCLVAHSTHTVIEVKRLALTSEIYEKKKKICSHHSGLFKRIECCVWGSKLNVTLMIVILILMICLRMMAMSMMIRSYTGMMGRGDIVAIFVHF